MSKILRALDSSNEAERMYAVQDIAEAEDKNFVIPLINRLKLEDSHAVKESIVFCLRKLPCSNIHEDLFEMFRSTDAYLRNAAVTLFGSEGKSAAEFLATRLDDADKEVRKLIMDALYETRLPDAVPAIRTGLQDPSDNVKITAVEYLGLLSDNESAEILLQLFKRTPVPMLKTTILGALLQIDDQEKTSEALALILPDGDIKNVDTLFLPEVLQMIAKIKDRQEIQNFLEQIDDIDAYAEDIIKSLRLAKERFPDILESERIFGRLIQIIKNPKIDSNIRSNAIEFLLEDEPLNSEQFYQIGLKLKNDASMGFGCVQLLEASGEEAGFQEIENIMNETTDFELRALCEDIISTVESKSS